MSSPNRFALLLRTAALACFAAVAAPAGAADAALESAADDAFKAADFDGDGKVTWEEFRNRVVRVFGHFDANSDGRIAGQEHPPAVDDEGKPAQPGNVSAESFTGAVEEAFKASDKDGDGALSLAEWSGNKN
jgi:hypothetical protein